MVVLNRILCKAVCYRMKLIEQRGLIEISVHHGFVLARSALIPLGQYCVKAWPKQDDYIGGLQTLVSVQTSCQSEIL